MKIGSRVYVSLLSRSKIAGEAGTLIGSSARDGYKIRTDFGVIGYVAVRHVSEIVESDAPSPSEPAKCDTDVAHMYLTQIRPLDLSSLKEFKFNPTDLLCRAITFKDFYSGRKIAGFVTDQWIEEDVELLNVVHNGEFTVIPRSLAICTLKRHPEHNLYSVDSYI